MLGIIDALEHAGHKDKAAYLRAEWEKKVKYFLNDDCYPWVSEMPVDSTAFESTYAIAKYALSHTLRPDERLWQDRNSGRWYSHPVIDVTKHREFLKRQLAANLACRGTIEPAYHTLGSDFRGCGESFYMLSYMSQMGGWAILDQGLYLESEPAALIRLGYASLLSSWALVNAGPKESNFGYWFPGALHDGAAGWGFTPQKSADEWNPAVKRHSRGPWPVDGEIDHGLAAGVEASCTVVVDDPLFGRIALGGEHAAGQDESMRVVPKDGVRQRFHCLAGGQRLHLILDRDGFAATDPIVIDKKLRRIELMVESRTASDHETTLTIQGLPPGDYSLSVGNSRWHLKVTSEALRVSLPVSNRRPCQIILSPLHRRSPIPAK